MAVNGSELELICMEMISATGEGRGKLFEAIDAYKSKDYSQCRKLMEEAEDLLNQAHQVQFQKLMKPQANGEEIQFSILLIHAMDLLMITTSEKDMVKKFVDMER